MHRLILLSVTLFILIFSCAPDKSDPTRTYLTPDISLYVTDFDACPDDSLDDTEGIRKAIKVSTNIQKTNDVGVNIIFPASDYIISGPIEGDSKELTSLVLLQRKTYAMFILSDSACLSVTNAIFNYKMVE